MKTEKIVRVSGVVAAAMLASLLCFLPSTLAADQARLADVEVAAGLATFQPLISHRQVRVTVTGPEGFEVVKTFGADEAPAVELPGTDGLYKYELRFAPVLDREARKLLAAAREAGTDLGGGDKATDQRTVQRGWFSLAGGSVVPDLLEPEPKVVLTNGDGVIRNSLCVGFDCPDAPLFDDSTILMMENNTRIKFGDTSNSPFPNNDWEIEANSNLSGGASYLGFNDCGTADNDGGCAADLVFAVESGARASALYVESDGDVGIGTSNPVLDLHIVTSNTPSLRLDQDGSGGFTPQVWDIAGNEANFFVRDVTAGSRLPFRIRPGAPTSSIDIAVSGNVGIGTSSPTSPLHVKNADSSANGQMRVESTGNDARIELQNADGGTATGRASILMSRSGGFEGLRFMINNVDAMIIDENRRVGIGTTNPAGLLDVNGAIFQRGGVLHADFVFEPGYELESIAEHADFMWQNKHLPAVPPKMVDENGDEIVEIGSHRRGLLEELEKAHIYIEQLHKALQQQQQALDDLRHQVADLQDSSE